MYGLAPEKLLRLVYEPFYLAISLTFYETIKVDGFVKSPKVPFFVIPAKAGIQSIQIVTKALDSGFHRSDDFLRGRQCL